MIYGGLDFSISSPALSVYDSVRDIYNIHVWTQLKKYKRNKTKIDNYNFTIHYIDRSTFNHTYDFYYKLIHEILDWIDVYKIDLMGIEEFAFGGSGKLTILAECVGYLKFRYYEKTKNYIIPIPISFGKMIGNESMLGSASKYTNIKWFLENEINFLNDLELNIKDENPISDIVDSINILKVIKLFDHYNNGKEIPEKLKKSLDKWKINI